MPKLHLRSAIESGCAVLIAQHQRRYVMWDGTAFSGAKIALICETHLITYLRDDKAGIPFPGLWDLPGGGREADETPIECALREVKEEFGLQIHAGRVKALTRYTSHVPGGLDTYFCVAEVDANEIRQVKFGEEGQCWSLMPITEFIAHEQAIPHLQQRLRALLFGA
jgi:8-oxo-dGTP diphosphatase